MPSGHIHDFITYALLPPTFAGTYIYSGDALIAATATASMAFAGLMFGPDLDIKSRQYYRWGILRFIWRPYMALGHRARLSHGLLFSTLGRIIYFLVMLIFLAATALFCRDYLDYNHQASWLKAFNRVSAELEYWWKHTHRHYLWAIFAGLWFGAASHTLTDTFGSIARILRKMW
jgi:uncharacterized metal-binding protein